MSMRVRRRLLSEGLLTALVALSALLVTVPAAAIFPGDNGRIAYVTTAGDHKVIFTVDATGQDPQLLIDLGGERDAINPAWSWDGVKVAFAGQTSPGGPLAIFVASADGTGQPVQVTTSLVSDTDPAWAPNGQEIAFTHQGSDGTSVIGVVTLSNGAIRFLPGLGLSMEPSWAPDGTEIAFATKERNPCYGFGCLFQIWRAPPDGTTFGALATDFWDLHHPDWSPDGTRIVARFGHDEDPDWGPSGVRIYDASTGSPLNAVLCGIMTEPSFSPDGTYIVLTSRTFIDLDSTELTEPKLCVLRADGSAFAFWVDAPASDAAWGPVPGSAPPIPEPDTTPPTVELVFTPEPGPGGSFPTAPDVHVTATDNIGVSSIRCTYDGQWIGPYEVELIDRGLRGQVSLYGRGEHTLECSASDPSGNLASVSRTIVIDDTPPQVTAFSFSANPLRVGETSVVTEVAWDDQSGIAGGEVTVGDQPPAPMTASDWTLTAEIGAGLPAGFHPVVVRVRDGAGNEATTDPQTLVVYDPNAGSASGTGWIVPDPGAGDSLPVPIDGKTKGSFAFSVKYKTATATTPTGFFNFSYGKFKLQSEDLDWLVVTGGDTAYVLGSASIHGTGGLFPFRATIRDGASSTAPDHLVLEVWWPDADPLRDEPAYQASGDAGGQIQIQR